MASLAGLSSERRFPFHTPHCAEPGDEVRCSSQSSIVNFLLLPSNILPWMKHMPSSSIIPYPALLQSPATPISFLNYGRRSPKFTVSLVSPSPALSHHRVMTLHHLCSATTVCYHSWRFHTNVTVTIPSLWFSPFTSLSQFSPSPNLSHPLPRPYTRLRY